MDKIPDLLINLTAEIALKIDGDGGGGLLGGENGYGENYENDVFKMSRYCWCETDDCKLCNGTEPNFIFKPTGATVSWYKYIGRGMEYTGKLPKDWYEQCYKSLWPDDSCWMKIVEGESPDEHHILELCFNLNGKAIISVPISDSTVENIRYWNLDAIISDIESWNNDRYSAKLEEYKNKYPALEKWIAERAIKRHKEQIEWHNNWLKEIEDE